MPQKKTKTKTTATKKKQAVAKKKTTRKKDSTVRKKSTGGEKAPTGDSGKNRVLVIDGHAFIYRAYYAFINNRLVNPETGMNVSAIFGFYRMLYKLIDQFGPTHLVCVFDPPGPVFRKEIYKEYKANRKPMPDDLRPQVDQVLEMLPQTGFPVIRREGFEADDMMGSIARQWGDKDGHDVYLVTGDKDCYQLLSDQVRMIKGKKGITEFEILDTDWLRENLGMEPGQIPDYMGLIGDTSDNIPGVAGIGPKTARKYLEGNKTLESLFLNLDAIKNANARNKLEEGKESALLSRELATIKTDLKIDLKFKDTALSNFTADEFIKPLREAGLNQIYSDLKKKQSQAGDGASEQVADYGRFDAARVRYELIATREQLNQLVKKLKKQKVFAIDTETTSKRSTEADLLGISLSWENGVAWYIYPPAAGQGNLFDKPVPEGSLTLDEIKQELGPVLADPKIGKVGQNIKYDWVVLENSGLRLRGVEMDTMMASYLLAPDVRRHGLDDQVLDTFGYTTIKYKELVGVGKKEIPLSEVDPERVKDYACEDADFTWRLYEELKPRVKESGVENILRELEQPLIPVLGRMENWGVLIDRKYFSRLSQRHEKKLGEIEKKIHKIAGSEININSTRDLQKLLFEDLGLPTGKKTKTGYSTDVSVLESLQGKHPVVDLILEHRKSSKLLSTYIRALPELINPRTGRLHTSYSQTIAATGRLSSVSPNLQNIPIRDEAGREIRRGFIAADGFQLMSVDYSQVELRLMAHASEDPAMLEAYQKDRDIHRLTAANIFQVAEENVEPWMRDKAKVINFSIIYGITPFGLARSLDTSQADAREYIELYFLKYPGVRNFMEKTIAGAKKKGYVETLFGRRRYVGDLDSKNRFKREAAERIAVNSPIQGTSADIIKKAMLAIDSIIREKKLKSRMLLQVHDELVFEVHESETEDFRKIVVREMEGVSLPGGQKLKVPLKVEAGLGANWDESH